MSFSWNHYSNQNPAIVLSPMSGYSDSPFKQVVRLLTPDAIVVTEFLSTDAIYYGSEKTMRMMNFDKAEHPVILQVFGKDPQRFVYAAQMAEKLGYDGVDINMGCPAKKVIRSDHGSALVKIKNRETAMSIVSEMVKATKIPISVKTRIGWEKNEEMMENLLDFAKQLEKNGCTCLTLHGRTTKQGYSGKADWDPIYEVKRILNIPVMGNGDITSVSSFRNKLGVLDGVFVARATLGDPWILKDLCTYAKTPEKYKKYNDEDLDKIFPRADALDWKIKKPIVIEHCKLSVAVKGERLGMLEMRKHLAMYIKGVPGARALREKIVQVTELEPTLKLIESL